ncbi:hypothetical protein IFM89_038880 [Coptis chinensis]|uniref:Uncharacterized protein n=1 Tax=Coptis chinensis TaxID=261450 RepID=A0A835J0E4_9MAGN|nr:hypothetical protein IFM89_038880 [Coptis chinensis]
MHCDKSASGVQEGSNDMSSESDPFLAPTYESEDNVDDIEINEQGERINIVNEPFNVPSPVNVWLLDENMSLTTTLPASRWCTEAFPTFVDTEGALERGEGNVLVKNRSEMIEQAAPISVDEAAGSTGCHPQSPPPVVTTVESTGDCEWMHIILVHIRSLTMPPCLAPLGATLPLVSTTVAIFGIEWRYPICEEEAITSRGEDVKEQAPVRVTRSKRQLYRNEN